jgi:hypothetical protein
MPGKTRGRGRGRGRTQRKGQQGGTSRCAMNGAHIQSKKQSMRLKVEIPRGKGRGRTQRRGKGRGRTQRRGKGRA